MKRCKFVKAWIGRCDEIVHEGDYCMEHKKYKCHCGKQASRQCPAASSLVCGEPLCSKCECSRHRI